MFAALTGVPPLPLRGRGEGCKTLERSDPLNATLKLPLATDSMAERRGQSGLLSAKSSCNSDGEEMLSCQSGYAVVMHEAQEFAMAMPAAINPLSGLSAEGRRLLQTGVVRRRFERRW